MKHLDKFELHDAIIHRTAIDYPKKTVQIDIAYYPEPVLAKTRRSRLNFVRERAVHFPFS